ncbi:MAG: restriction endonuclease [Bacteroidia bacterium]|nr:restriction endonuclease [Bacteroidia bacterium]
MDKNLKEKYKKEFKDALVEFVDTLKGHVSTKDNQWTVKGFIDVYKNIYTISTDTKIVSKILEIHIFPLILEFANKFDYKLILAEKQNYYPDLTFVRKDNDDAKFALDLKTTFRRNDETAGFTLGSHGGYFKERDKDKNIQFPYNQYIGHYCLGIIYSKNDYKDELGETEVFQVNELEEEYGETPDKVGEREVTTVDKLVAITSVIQDFDFFVAEKWKIASDSRGSGNTANIGSIKKIEDLKNENGAFSQLGEEWFDEYWINYDVATMVKDGKTTSITNIYDFLEFKGRTDLIEKVVATGAKKRKAD